MNRTAILTAMTLVLSVTGVQANAAGFAKYDGIEGESRTARDHNHDKWIDLDSISWTKSKQRMAEDHPRQGMSKQRPNRVRDARRINRVRPGIEHEDIGRQ